MYVPTSQDLHDYEELHKEFKDFTTNAKVEITDETIDLLTKGMPESDPLRKESQRLKRHNKYHNMSALLAPYFFSRMGK